MTMRVRLEIIPFGMENMAYTIHKIDVNNTLRILESGHYIYNVIHQNVTRNEGGMLDGSIAHRRQDGPLVLAAAALQALIEGEEEWKEISRIPNPHSPAPS